MEKKRREHPPSLIPFGKSPGCQVPYIMPAQADTCAGAGAGSGSGGDSGLIGWLRSTRTKRQRGRGTNSGLKGGALVREGWWGLDLEWEVSEWLPVPWGYEKPSRGFEIPESSHRISDAPRWDGLPRAPSRPQYGRARHLQRGLRESPASPPSPTAWVLLMATL